jgi:hypothetical protein
MFVMLISRFEAVEKAALPGGFFSSTDRVLDA